MEVCIICGDNIQEEEQDIKKLTLQDCAKINNVSTLCGVNMLANVGDKVHENCCRAYISQDHLRTRVNSTQDANNNGFNVENCCLFCGEAAKFNEKKLKSGVELARISEDFLKSINNSIAKRNNDEWAKQVSSTISSLSELIGIGAVFHTNCRIGFRTNKPLRKNKKSTQSAFEYKRGFLDIVNLIQTKKRAQYSIKELIDEMNSFSDGNAYSFNQMKTNLLKYFGEEIVISTFQNKKTLVTLRSTSYEILNEFYESSNAENDKNKRIIKTSETILSDIKKVTPNKDFYPSSSDISLDEAKKFLPESLQLLLSRLITGHNAPLKIVSIGQAIVQAAHRENVMCPLQMALATQMHYFTGSKFIVNTLNAFGLCSTYGEVRKFQICASIAFHKQRSEMPKQDVPVLKYVADNVDHNLRTLDGKNTFHGMGIICIHHLKQTPLKIPRTKANLQDVKEIGSVEIVPYFQKLAPNTSLFYRKLNRNEIKDPYSDLDLLWKMSWSENTTRPGWSGMMQLVQNGSYPEKATVTFLPIIDMNPTDLTCINSTLHFICKDASKFNATASATFDQPLHWKARTIIENEPVNSPLKRMVLCLGGFHMKMSFLGAIGHIMSGSGLDSTLGEVYGENSVIHMLSGKAYSRAIRGFFMVDSALNSILFEDILNDELLTKVGDLLKSTLDGHQDIDKLQENELIELIKSSFSKKKESLKKDTNSRLWLLYMEMIDILRSNIRADRTGNFKLHLETVQRMIAFFIATGHIAYARSAYIYLQDMINLKKSNPAVFSFFSNGHFITRRTDRFWAGLPDDLIIEQLLMRSLKVSGGLTRGRGMDETKRSLWLNSMPAKAEFNNAIQDLTNFKTETSEQHKECGKTRLIRDNKDTDCIFKYLKERSPFDGATPNALRNIADGLVSTSKANVDQAEEIGLNILKTLEDKNVFEHSFERCKQVIRMSSKNEISIDGEMVIIDPDTLFQRLLLLILQSESEEEKEGSFCYELCHKSPSLFDNNGLMREANSSALVTKIGSMNDNHFDVEKLSNVIYVLEGDWILDKIQWQKGETFGTICERYVKYVKQNYGKATIIFDCSNSPSTNDEFWLRDTKGVLGKEVLFSVDMSLNIKKELFLKNKKNKLRFIELLTKKLEDNGCSVTISFDNVAVTMTNIAGQYSKMHDTVVIGKQVDLIMVLCFYATLDDCCMFYMFEESSKKPLRVFNITELKNRLGGVKSKHLLFAHAMGGCKTTSQLHNISKISAYNKLDNNHFANLAEIFCCSDSSEESIIKAGNEVLISLYNGKKNETLNKLRYRKFVEKNKRGASAVTCKALPPTEAAAKFHYLRVFYQVQVWLQNKLNPLNFGWVERNSILRPVSTKIPVAPANILAKIRCGCKGDCDSARCNCFANNLKCSTACKVCTGSCCSNRSPIEEDSDLDEEV